MKCLHRDTRITTAWLALKINAMFSPTTSTAGQCLNFMTQQHILVIYYLCFRYRRDLKSLEENLDEHSSLVPKLNFPDRRIVPAQTSPELVMFCRRVYDFRSKRLVEEKKKK